MKKITFLFLLSFSFVFSQNLLTNGDLENLNPVTGGQANGLMPNSGATWTTSQTTTTRPSINSNASVAYAGDRFINLQNDFQSFRQAFTAVSGTNYRLTLYCQFIAPQGQPAANDGIYISISQPGGTNNNGTQFDPVIQFYVNPSLTNANWNEYTFNFTAPDSALLILVSKQTRVPTSNPNNACRMDNFSIVPIPLSVNNLETVNFKAYPNPASSILNLSANNQINSLEFYNHIGQLIFTKEVNTNLGQVNVSDLSTGVYVVKANFDDFSGTFKFVKK